MAPRPPHLQKTSLSWLQLIEVSSPPQKKGGEPGPSLLNRNRPSWFRMNSCWEQAGHVRLPGDPGRYCCVSYSPITLERSSLQAKTMRTKVRLCLVSEDPRTRSICLDLMALSLARGRNITLQNHSVRVYSPKPARLSLKKPGLISKVIKIKKFTLDINTIISSLKQEPMLCFSTYRIIINTMWSQLRLQVLTSWE